MDKVQAEEHIKVIRDIMEKSTRYTNFSGLSGIIAGLLALAGTAATIWVAWNHIWHKMMWTYVGIWLGVFFLAILEDGLFAHRNAKRNGESIWNPVTWQIIKAVTPALVAAIALSVRIVTSADPLPGMIALPALWAICYGVAACAAGMFSVREVTVFGIVQLLTGVAGLFIATEIESSVLLLAVSLGLYHILFGVWMSRKYGW